MNTFTKLLYRSLIVLSVLVLGCQQAVSNSSSPNSSSTSGPVQGTIGGKSFTEATATASASTTVTNDYTIVLNNSTGVDPNGVTFTVGPTAQSYSVTTLGQNGGLSVIASTGGYNEVGFDSGTVVITKVDTTNKQIVGSFSSVNTSDGTSSLSGSFTATIQ